MSQIVALKDDNSIENECIVNWRENKCKNKNITNIKITLHVWQKASLFRLNEVCIQIPWSLLLFIRFLFHSVTYNRSIQLFINLFIYLWAIWLSAQLYLFIYLFIVIVLVLVWWMHVDNNKPLVERQYHGIPTVLLSIIIFRMKLLRRAF